MSHDEHAPFQGTKDYGTMPNPSADLHKNDVDSDIDDDDDDDEASGDSSEEEEQAGVKTIEVITRTWSSWSLSMAYVG